MAKFLTTAGVSQQLEEIIKNADERLMFISPYLKVNDRLKELLEDKDRLKIDIRVVHGDSQLHRSEITWLNSLSYVRIGYCQNLHAKCYLNEKEALLTSMNLYEFSQVNNHEIGLVINRAEETDLYDSILRETQRLFRISDESETGPRHKRSTNEGSEDGFCIKCNKGILYRPKDSAKEKKQPFCDRCNEIWGQTEEGKRPFEAPQEYCHAHGESCPSHGENHS